ncbi:low-affinity glucose transporter HXT4-like [Humulus lupulus]|uniref:low-affinity glucose transporter HXT4-like n=1 Tax=Humulus lupulus TaxID=3486 RepID=UPI002B409A22|nr:low-affinity glucose transporter HXT4-like [Humulus lupulus]
MQGAMSLDMGGLFTGYDIVIFSYVVPIYIAEISPKHLRGGLTTLNQIMIVLGGSLALIIGTIISWRSLALTGLVPCIVLLVGLDFVLESPRWLLKENLTSDRIVNEYFNGEVKVSFGQLEDALNDCTNLDDTFELGLCYLIEGVLHALEKITSIWGDLVSFSMLKPRPSEVEFYNSLTNVNVHLYIDLGVDEAEGEAEDGSGRDLMKEAKYLAEVVKSTSIFYEDVSKEKEPTPPTVASSSGHVLHPEWDQMVQRLERVEQGQQRYYRIS